MNEERKEAQWKRLNPTGRAVELWRLKTGLPHDVPQRVLDRMAATAVSSAEEGVAHDAAA